MSAGSVATTATIVRHDPNHDVSWESFLGSVMVLLGIVVLALGVLLLRKGWTHSRKNGKLPVLLATSCVPVLVGIGTVALGVWIF